MNVSKILAVSIFTYCMAMLPYKAHAQFFKKLEKALEKVDKVLESSSSETSQSSQSTEQKSSSNSSGEIHIATYGTEKAMPIKPHRTSKTKLITVNSLPYIGEFSDGIAYVHAVKEQSGYYIDTLGNKLFEYNYSYGTAPKFCKGAMIYKGRTDAFIVNRKGETISRIPNVLSVTDFSKDGIAAITIGVPGKQVRGMLDHYNIFINTEGKQVFKDLVFPHTMENLKPARPLNNGLSAFYNYQLKKWGYRDANGKIVIPAQFGEVKDFSDELACVKTNVDGTFKWGYINTSGEFTIQPVYTIEPGTFKNGLAPVINKEGKTFYINKSGKIVTKGFEIGTEFHNGYAIVRDQYMYIMSSDIKYVAVFNKNYFNFPLKSFVDNDEHADIKWNDKDIYIKGALVASNGDVLISHVSGFFEGNYAPCYMSSYDAPDDKTHSGFINRKGEYIVEFVESEF